MRTMCFLSLAYASNLGGIGFPTGTGANLVLWGEVERSFEGSTGLDFVSWMLFNIPSIAICAVIMAVWLEFKFIGFGKSRRFPEANEEKVRSVRSLVRRHYDALGRASFHETAVLGLLLLIVVLWIFRKPQFVAGWAEPLEDLLGNGVKIGNATPAILVLLLLFVIPAKPACFSSTPEDAAREPWQGCLTWRVVHEKVPWGLVLLMGGGFAMAEGADKSCLSSWMGSRMRHLSVLPGPALVLLVSTIVTFLTEIISNITCASVFLPVVREMSVGIGVHPLYLMIPVAVSCSYAFMLPVANPPNAIAFSAADMKSTDMMRAGLLLNIACILVLNVMLNTVGVTLFGLGDFPEWARSSNSSYVNSCNVP